MDAADPKRIGSYEVLAKLAEGGVGAVYLARRSGPLAFSRLVAIKRLRPEFTREPDLVAMFTDEARLGARIHHANVVSILELGADADGYYVVMEYVEGSSLAHVHWHATRGDRRLPRAIALRIVLDALAGLHAAHEVEGDDGVVVNLVHRDVSPQNILLGTDGLARLGDFGIARAEALRAFETRGAPSLKGKFEYMAPEQFDRKVVDRTTDLFAMGIVLWELLTGRGLFSAPNQVTTIQRVCFDPIPGPRSVDPAISLELERICLRALSRPPSQRFPTAAAFAEELERAARGDAGIATQREVAAWMAAVLGPLGVGGKPTARDLGLRAASSAVVDLAGAVRGKASTYQLPPSEPLLKVAAVSSHPPVAGALGNTDPYRRAPPLVVDMDGPTLATSGSWGEESDEARVDEAAPSTPGGPASDAAPTEILKGRARSSGPPRPATALAALGPAGPVALPASGPLPASSAGVLAAGSSPASPVGSPVAVEVGIPVAMAVGSPVAVAVGSSVGAAVASRTWQVGSPVAPARRVALGVALGLLLAVLLGLGAWRLTVRRASSSVLAGADASATPVSLEGPEAGAGADDPALAATFVDVSRAAPPVTAKAAAPAPLPSSRAAGKPGAVGRSAHSGAD